MLHASTTPARESFLANRLAASRYPTGLPALDVIERHLGDGATHAEELALPELRILADQMDWMDQVCSEATTAQRFQANGSGGVMVHGPCAALVVVKQALVRALAAQPCDGVALLCAVAKELVNHHVDLIADFDPHITSDRVGNALPAAWWVALIALQTSASARDHGRTVHLKFDLRATAHKQQLMVCEPDGLDLAQTIHANSFLLQSITNRLSGVQQVHAGRWGTLALLRLPAPAGQHLDGVQEAQPVAPLAPASDLEA
jgi:hypothetical protein